MEVISKLSVLHFLFRGPVRHLGVRSLCSSAIASSRLTSNGSVQRASTRQILFGGKWLAPPLLTGHFSTVYNDPAAINNSPPDRYSKPLSTEIDERKLFVGMLNFRTSDKTLKDYFSKYGEIESAMVARASLTRRSKGYGFVHFKDPESVNKALEEVHNLEGKELRLSRGSEMPYNSIYVPNVPAGLSKDQLKEYFSQFGTVRAVDFVLNKETKELSHAYVKFFTQEDADKALKSSVHQVDQHQIEVTKSRSKLSNVLSSKKVYVKGLSADTTIEKVKAHFEKYGALTGVDINVYHDQESQQRNIIAFVSYAETSFANKVVEAENHIVDGTHISVRMATDSRLTRKHPLKLSIEGLSLQVTPEELKEYFGKFGPVDSIFMINERLRPQAFKEAVVQFQYARAVDTAMEYKDHSLLGEPFKVRQLGWRPQHSYEKKYFDSEFMKST